VAKRILGLSLILAIAAAAPAAAQVVYVGDSLGVGTEAPLRGQLGDVSLDLDAKIGRPSAAGLGVLEQLLSGEHQAVVFDLGTNDDPAAPQALAANLAAARELAGGRCMVVATLNRPPLNGVSVAGLNRAVTSFAAADAATELVDWHAAAEAEPSLLFDGVHASGSGYALRAEMFAQAIRSCLTLGTGADAMPAPGPQLERERPPRQPTPRPRPAPDPVRAVAQELARAVVVGAEFG
jgi:hypothetical protein